MKIEYFGTDFVSEYKNHGQALEQEFRYYITGEIAKADNLRADKGCDLGTLSIKSARATVCRGTDIKAHLATDKATAFVYLSKAKKAYTMSREEYIAFVETFAKVQYESKKNGGHAKLRLGHETRALIEWLEERA